MKQLAIAFQTGGGSLPLNYQYGIQSMLYGVLRDSGDDFWHDAGAKVGSRRFKLFVFSQLRGRRIMEGKRIRFTDRVYLDVRSVRDDFCEALADSFARFPELNLCGVPLRVEAMKLSTEEIVWDTLAIRMLSPMTVYESRENHTRYFTPLDAEFGERISANFRNKFRAFYGKDPRGGVELVPLSVGAEDKTVTRFKGIYITAWKGEYRLAGYPDDLTFLYYTGLGAKNSGGFGMFEPL